MKTAFVYKTFKNTSVRLDNKLSPKQVWFVNVNKFTFYIFNWLIYNKRISNSFIINFFLKLLKYYIL